LEDDLKGIEEQERKREKGKKEILYHGDQLWAAED
jgi:hypothetical protein